MNPPPAPAPPVEEPATAAEPEVYAFPMSFAQQRLWFLDQWQPGSAAYNVPAAFRVSGRLQAEVLARALSAVVARHEALRTTLGTGQEGAPVQIVHPATGMFPRLETVDLSCEPSDAREPRARSLAKEEAHQPFDLARGPLWRVKLIRLGEADHVLLLTFHHSIFDGWSMGVLVRELLAHYDAFAAGRTPEVPDLPIQYADYSLWQQEQMQGEALQDHLAYWRKRLAGLPALDLPTDFPRPPIQTFRGERHRFSIPEATAEALRGLCREERVSLFMPLLAAYQAVLARWSGQEDIAVGSPIAGRGQPETQNLIGFLVNTLVLRADLSGDPSFRSLLGRVRSGCLEAYEHQDLPFDRLVADLQPERDLSRSPLFQAVFTLQQEAPRETAGAELRLRLLDAEMDVAKYDLTLSVREGSDGLQASLEYNPDLFEAATIARMAGHFLTLLSSAVADPDAPLSSLGLLTREELHQVTVRWNSTAADFPDHTTVHALFETQARRTPDAPAVVLGDSQLTYAELDDRAEGLAARLRRLGAAPGTLVGLSVERSLDLVVGVLGILKAGSAFVPLDPSYPAERIQFMLEDSAVPLLVTQAQVAPRLPPTKAQIVLLEGGAEDDLAPVNGPAAGATDLAYVIYTSGSTGRPKGACIEHRGVCNLATAQREAFAVGPGDRVLQFASLSFDAAVWEIVMALLNGAALHLAPPGVPLAGEALLDALTAGRITLATLPPSALRTLPPEADLPDLRTLVVAGEACPPDLVEAWSPGRRFVNAYGPTEATICASWATLTSPAPSSPPIGKPLPNTRLYVLDAERNPVPIGVPGELHIGGVGLARGYLHRPDLTAERFVEDPFVPGERVYRTGDLARWRPDGQLEFLGRLDHQVKIRGFRIELGEVEQALLALPDVREAVAIAWEETPGDKRLVAYVVPRDGRTLQGPTLRDALGRSLPAHLVPSALVVLPSLPLTPNGKIDRKALPAPEETRSGGREAYVAPRTPTEEKLAAIWKQVLRVDRVGVHDNFFDLGGDSILSIQVVARATQQGLRLTAKQMFQHQTVASLAAVAGATALARAEQSAVTGEAPLTPIQHWFFERDLPARHHFNQAVLLEVAPEVEASRLALALSKVAEHHDALRLRFDRGPDGAWRASHAPPGGNLLPFKRIDLSPLASDPAAQEAALDAQADRLQSGFALEDGPLAGACLFDLGPTRGMRLLLAIHHLAVDGVSWRILLEDLETAYAQLSRGETVALPPKTTSFKEWATGLATYAASSSDLARELPFWLAQQSRLRAPLPRDHDRGANSLTSARSLTVHLTPEETQALLQHVPRVHRTQINDALLAALLHATSRWTGRSSMLVDVEGHGREEILKEIDLSRTVGWFTTLTPVLFEAPAATDPLACLKAVKERLRAIPRRGIGHGLLRHLAAPATRTRLAALPQPEVLFNYLGQLDSLVRDGGGLVRGFAQGPRGRDFALEGGRCHVLEINGAVLGGRLTLAFTYSENLHAEGTIRRVADSFLEGLRALVRQSGAGSATGYAPSDFPLARLDQRQLDRALKGREGGVADVYPLSPMQEGMLFHTLLEPGSGAYFEQVSFRVEGDFHPDAFEAAWHAAAARHPPLRTAFVWEGLPHPVQVVHREAPIPFTRHDWRGLSEPEQRARLDALLAEDRRRGFDLTAAPLLRFHVVRLGERSHQVVWSHHHLLLDGWSLPVLLQEIFALYEAHREGREASLAPARSYGDFIQWLSTQDPKAAEARWREELRGFTAPTPLGVDRPQPAGASGYAEADAELSEEATTALGEFARRQRVTLNQIFQGAWGAILSRYSGERDVVFGATVSGRPSDLDGVESMVGLFINTIPVRLDVDPDAPVAAWLQAAQTRQAEMRAHEHTPLVRIQAVSSVPRGAQLFESLLVFENYPMERASDGPARGITIGGFRAHEQTNYPLTLVAGPGPRLRLKVSYDRARFDAATAERLLGHLATLLEAIPRDPARRLRDLPLLTPDELNLLLVAWNDTATADLDTRPFPLLFEAQAERTPDAVALTFGEQTMTYRELDGRANQLAHHLRRLGVGPDVLVGLAAERTPDAAVGILGIWKAGGAYVPLDPTYPRKRLQHMITDTNARVVVGHAHLLDRLPLGGATAVRIDADWEPRIAPERRDPPPSVVKADHLAYVIYTSGSTGTPKGVLVEHKGLGNLARTLRTVWDVQPGSRLLQFATLSFDGFVAEIAAALLNGATLCMPPTGAAQGGPDLHRLLRDVRITHAVLPPAAMRTLPDEPLPDLATMVSVGEACPVDLAEQWAVGRRFVNGYGPTEATVGALSWIVPASARGAPPLGRPFINTRLYLLDPHGNPVPVGVPGEIYIGGIGVARGYLNRPDLTAARFVPNPWVSGDRLYRTGDLGRYRPDGVIEFVGRTDDQVKLRGYRVELGEVEQTLLLHRGVRHVAVVAREDTPGEKRLVAYVAPRDAARPPTVAELREHLKRTLPEFMVPSVFVTLPELPLTPSGKIDRKTLPAPEAGRRAGDGEYVAPRTPVEEMVAAVWSQVLGVPRVGAQDDFFELGGHSLLATQAVSRLRDTFHVDLPLRALFDAPTVEGIAKVLLGLADGGAGAAMAPLARNASEREGPVPLSFAQQRLWFLDQIDPGSAAYVIPAAFRLTGPLDRAALGRALAAIVRRHEALRTTFRLHQGSPTQVVAEPGPLTLPFDDLMAAPVDEREEAARRLLREEATRAFDLQLGPLYRFRLVRIAEEEHLLSLTFHHIAYDGWSTGILVRELTALYEAERSGIPAALPELPIQYADYAGWQRATLQGEAFEAQLAYWHERLASVPVLDLPTDHPRPPTRSLRGDYHAFELGPDLARRLEDLCREEGVTLFMPLLTAYQTLLHRYTAAEDISVGTPVAGRTRAETEPLLGFFVNTLVLRTDLSGDPTFRELLARVRETCLGAYMHQDVPFEKLVEEMAPERDLSRTPLFQAMFALQNVPQDRLELGGVTLATVPTHTGAAKFDLTLALQATPKGLVGAIEYSTDLFEPATIARMAGHLRTLLEAATADPDRPLSRIPLLTSEERAQALGEGRPTPTYRADTPLHHLFEARVAETPDALAVTFEGRALTYRELNAWANRIAHALREAGVGPDVLVGLCAERSLDMVAGILGILKAGGAYVPLDPQYPRERLQFMLEDANAPVLLTQGRLVGTLPDHPRVLLLEQYAAGAAESPNPGETGVKPHHLAYVIYTSGSTGKPKGVMVEHQQVARLFTATDPWFGFGRGDVWTLFHSFAFDFSVWELWGALLYGGRLVIVPHATARNPEAFHDLLHAERVTVLNQTPSAFRQLMAADARSAMAPEDLALRLVIFGGEALETGSLRGWFDRHGDERPRLVNMYGITETTVHVTYRPITRADTERPHVSPVGVPIPDLELHLLDPHGEPVPVGVTGELYVGGAGVARGYLNRPELNALRFVPDPTSSVPGARLYRSGDLARRLPDGDVAYLGRMDHQVKIRGFRIELGEIESALVSHERVQEAVVLALDGNGGEKRLVAYVVPRDPRSVPTPQELKAHLRHGLPEHMVPAAFVALNGIPLTQNGKVDRRALPAPSEERPDLEVPYVAPRNEVEATLCALWGELLSVARVGVNDNFFDLGGTSLLSIQAVTRAQARGLPVKARDLFEHQTPATLAASIARSATAAAPSSVIPLRREGSRRPLFMVHPAGGTVGCYVPLARGLGADQPFYGLQALGTEDDGPAQRRIEEMARTYVADVRKVQPHGPYRLSGWSLGGMIAFEMANLLLAEGERVELLALVDPGYGADPEQTLQADRLAKECERLAERLDTLAPEDPARGLVHAELTTMLRYIGIPADFAKVGLVALRRYLKVFDAQSEAGRHYRPNRYAGDVKLLLSEDTLKRAPDLADRWREGLTTGTVQVDRVPGDHWSMMLTEHGIAALVEVLKRAIAEVETA